MMIRLYQFPFILATDAVLAPPLNSGVGGGRCVVLFYEIGIRLMTISPQPAPPGYKTQAADTTKEAERLQFELLRRIPIERRVQQVLTFDKQTRAFFWNTLAQKYPQLAPRDRKRKLIEFALGETFCQIDVLVETDFMLQSPIELAAAIGKILDDVDILYFVGGGLASSILGERRTTEDADIAVLLNEDNVHRLIEAMLSDFYISEVAVEDALSNRTNTFNVIHLASAIKADIYPIRANDEFRTTAITRRRRVYSSDFPNLSFYICSAEDIVLQKLIWYRIAGNESHKQWRDVLGVLKLQAEQLDFDYLWHWANRLELIEEVDRALTQAGLQ